MIEENEECRVKKPKKFVKEVTHTIRTMDGGRKTLLLGRRQAMSLMCTECMGWESDPLLCTVKLCPLWPWRVRTRVGYVGDKVKANAESEVSE